MVVGHRRPSQTAGDSNTSRHVSPRGIAALTLFTFKGGKGKRVPTPIYRKKKPICPGGYTLQHRPIELIAQILQLPSSGGYRRLGIGWSAVVICFPDRLGTLKDLSGLCVTVVTHYSVAPASRCLNRGCQPLKLRAIVLKISEGIYI